MLSMSDNEVSPYYHSGEWYMILYPIGKILWGVYVFKQNEEQLSILKNEI